METYAFYPPQTKSTEVPYQVLTHGAEDCRHGLLSDSWCERITVQDGVVFITFTCHHCGRQVCQSLDEVSAPKDWNGAKR